MAFSKALRWWSNRFYFINARNENIRESDRPDRATLLNALSAIPTGNLVVATPWISSRPILTDAETIQKIQNIFTRAGVAPEIATRFTSSLTNRILEINKNLIQKLGSQDIGNQLANSILKKNI